MKFGCQRISCSGHDMHQVTDHKQDHPRCCIPLCSRSDNAQQRGFATATGSHQGEDFFWPTTACYVEQNLQIERTRIVSCKAIAGRVSSRRQLNVLSTADVWANAQHETGN